MDFLIRLAPRSGEALRLIVDISLDLFVLWESSEVQVSIKTDGSNKSLWVDVRRCLGTNVAVLVDTIFITVSVFLFCPSIYLFFCPFVCLLVCLVLLTTINLLLALRKVALSVPFQRYKIDLP